MNYINKGKRDILLFPDFSNIQKIENVRKKYDELYGIIKPHITLAFPFHTHMSSEEIKEHLKLHLKDIKSFAIKMHGISIHEDSSKNTNYIFLNLVKGKKEIIHIHKIIYEKVLNKSLNFKYIPHITLGDFHSNGNEEKIKEDLKELENVDFETVIDKIYLEKVGENEESIIEFKIDLKK